MSDWEGKLYIPSFRGVDFFFQSYTYSNEKNTQKKRPIDDTDDFSVENVTVREKNFSIKGCVYGPNYTGQRDALIKALENRAPGELIHPYFGKITAVCDSFSVEESLAKGGAVFFNMTFKPNSGINLKPSATSRKLRAERKANEIKKKNFQFKKIKFSSKTLDKINKFLDEYERVVTQIKRYGQELTLIALKFLKLRSRIKRNIGSPVSLANNFLGIVSLLDHADLVRYDFFSDYKDKRSLLHKFLEGSSDDMFSSSQVNEQNISDRQFKHLGDIDSFVSALVYVAEGKNVSPSLVLDVNSHWEEIMTDAYELGEFSPIDNAMFFDLQTLKSESLSLSSNLAKTNTIKINNYTNPFVVLRENKIPTNQWDNFFTNNKIKNSFQVIGEIAI